MDMHLKADFIESFQAAQVDAYIVAKEHGFHEVDDNPLYVPTALALIGSEVSEALAAHRKGLSSGLSDELADIVIRTMDLSESLNINLADAIIKKMDVNKNRPFKHGNKRY